MTQASSPLSPPHGPAAYSRSSAKYAWLLQLCVCSSLLLPPPPPQCAAYSRSSAQYAWLLRDLAAVDRARTPWLIVSFHAPWYNSNYAHQVG